MHDAAATLKTALALLVEDLGGCVAAASVVGRDPGRVSEWTGRHHDALPRLADVVALERVAASPRVTAALASLHGLVLARPLEGGRGESVAQQLGSVMRTVGLLVADAAGALADGAVSTAEASALTHKVAEARVALDRLDAALRATEAGR